MSGLNTDFNVAPFYDDYNEASDYYRILFRPATAVQARELTQLQTILQNQISRFGDSIYKDGTIIEGCNFHPYPNINQIKFKDSNTSTLDFTTLTVLYADIAEDANNTVFNSSNTYLLVSNTSGLRASIFRAFSGTENYAPDTNRAYVQYLNTGNNNVTTFSQASEQIDVYSSTQDKLGLLSASNKLGVIYTLSSNSTVNALGVGYGMRVGKGIIYQKGFFLKTNPSNFIISEHVSNAAGIVIGFDTNESIVSPYEDPSLFDNSQGSTNYSAPGAYRLKLNPVPVYYDSSNTAVALPNNFLTIVSFDQGTGQYIVRKDTSPQYSTLGDVIAKQAFETNGDFILKPFSIDVQPHESNTSLFYYVASPGIAYIDGHRVENLATTRVPAPRGIFTQSIDNDILNVSIGNYYYVKEVAGTPDLQGLESITFYDTFQQSLSLYPTRNTPSGTALGTANIKALKFYSGIKGTPTAQYLLYVFNIQLNPGVQPSRIKSVYATSGSYGSFYADIVPDPSTGQSTLQESTLSAPLYDIGVSGMKSLVSNTGQNSTSFYYRNILTAALTQYTDAGNRRSHATFTVPGPDIFPYGVGFLDDISSTDINITFATDTFSNTIITNAQIYGGSSNVITSPTDFTTSLYVGDSIALINTVTNSTVYGTIANVNSSNSITLNTSLTLAGNLQLKQFFKQGEAVNFNGSGNTIQQDSLTSLTVSLALDPDSSSYNVYAQVPLYRTAANPIQKVVNKVQYVKINCGTNVGGTTGPWALGISDVYSISNVYVGTSYSTSNPNYAQWFNLDTGQRDSYYGNARLSLDPQYNGSLTSLSKLLVEVNCFTPNVTSTQSGFYSVDSYPIDDANTNNQFAIATAEIPIYRNPAGIVYDLRNCIDMRPMLANTAAITNVVSYATENPANNTNTFITTSNITIDPDTHFTYNATYYLPRIDALVMTKDGVLIPKLGPSQINPQPPALNKTGLSIAQIYVPPYPSLTFTEAE
jgi:Domain of unknown function (DUF4815)